MKAPSSPPLNSPDNPAAEITGRVLPCPSLKDVVSTVRYGVEVMQEEGYAYEKCIERQGAACDVDMEMSVTKARGATKTLLASTAATLKVGLSVLSHLRRLQ